MKRFYFSQINHSCISIVHNTPKNRIFDVSIDIGKRETHSVSCVFISFVYRHIKARSHRQNFAGAVLERYGDEPNFDNARHRAQ